MRNKMIKVLIADDHAVVRRGIKQILSEDSDIQVLGEASNSDEVLALLYEQNWDILILDITMPGKSGLDALIEINRRKPELPVLILTIHPEREIAVRAFRTGASGYLTKDSIPGELIKAVRKIHAGGKYIGSDLAESFILSLDQEKPPHHFLSEREFQVFCLIASGHTLSQISKELSLSVKTISTYRARVLEKLNLKSNIELTHYALKHKLVTAVP